MTKNKYTGLLNERRTPTDQFKLLAGIGEVLHLDQITLDLANRQLEPKEGDDLAHILHGLALLFRHYKISGDMGATQMLVTLTLELARDHVPYFMPPTTGKRADKKLSKFPLIHNIIIEAEQHERSVEQIWVVLANFFHTEPESLQRELRAYRKDLKRKQ